MSRRMAPLLFALGLVAAFAAQPFAVKADDMSATRDAAAYAQSAAVSESEAAYRLALQPAVGLLAASLR